MVVVLDETEGVSDGSGCRSMICGGDGGGDGGGEVGIHVEIPPTTRENASEVWGFIVFKSEGERM